MFFSFYKPMRLYLWGLVCTTTFVLVFWLACTRGEACIREWAYIPFRNLAVFTLEISGVYSGK